MTLLLLVMKTLPISAGSLLSLSLLLMVFVFSNCFFPLFRKNVADNA